MKQRSLIIGVCAVIALTISGCKSTADGRKTLAEDVTITDLKTKPEIMREFGGPSNILYLGDQELMIYRHRLGRGGGIGVGNYAVAFLIQREHQCADTAIFRIDKQGRVIDSSVLQNTDKINNSIWPFD